MLKTIFVLIIICEIIGMAASDIRSFVLSLVFYTQLSNLAGMLSAGLLLVMGAQEWIIALRYLSACMLVMTMLVTVFVMVPTMKDTKLLLWSRAGFFLHVVCPVLNVFSYVFLEQHARARLIWFPVLVTLIYGDIMLYFNYQKKVDGPYPFLRVYHQSKTSTVLWFIALLILIAGIGWGVTSASALC